jgi:putative acetyltransferase
MPPLTDVTIAPDDPLAPDVRRLLAAHLDFTHGESPPEDVHALDSDGLVSPTITFFSARADGELLAVGALRRLSPTHAEVKSMHTAAAARGRGIGRRMLDHLLAVARAEECTRVSLETGTSEAFAAARSLYAAAGFRTCEPFGDYFPSRHSVCMTLEL